MLKVLPKLGLNGSTVVEYSTQHPKVEGSSPDAAAVTGTKQRGKELHNGKTLAAMSQG